MQKSFFVLAGSLLLTPLVTAAPEWLIIGNDSKIECRREGLTKVAPGEDTVTLIDLSDPSGQKMTHLPLPNSIFGPPTNLAITPDQSLAIVANSVHWKEVEGEWTAEPASELHLVDLTTTPPTRLPDSVACGKQPSGLAISRDGKQLLVANRADQSVSLFTIAGQTLTLLDTIAVEGEAAAVAFHPDGKKALVAKFSQHAVGQLSIVDGKLSYDVGQDIPVGRYCYNLKITPDGALGIVCNTGNNGLPDGHQDTLSLIDLSHSSPHVFHTLPVGDGPEGIAVSADGKLLAIPLLNGSTDIFEGQWFHRETGEVVLYTIEGEKISETSRVATGAFPEGIAFNEAGTHLYVANLDDENLSVFSITDGTLTPVGEPLPLPGKPGSMGTAHP